MGLTVCLETEAGESLEQVEDPTNILHRLLPRPADANYRWCSTIDWYGDTVFNRLQAPHLLEEWRRISTLASQPDEVSLMRAVERMAEKLEDGGHIYLRFYGD